MPSFRLVILGGILSFATFALLADSPVITSVINGASLGTQLGPGSLVDIFGTNLPTGVAAQLGSTPIQPLTETTTEWTFVVPSTFAAGTYTLLLGTNQLSITLSSYAPALFSTGGAGSGTVEATRNGGAILPSNPALPGDTITILATGLGAATSGGAVTAPVMVTLGGSPVTTSSVTVGEPGTYNVTFMVPSTIATGSLNIAISIGGQTSNTLTLPVGAGVVNIGPVITAVENGASFASGFPIDSYLTITGVNLAPAGVSLRWDSAIVNGQLPTQLDGVMVTVGGQPAYVEYISPTQVNVLAPNIAAGTVSVVVQNLYGISPAIQAAASTYQPAFFQYQPTGGSNIYAVATHTDFTYAVPGAVPAKPGETIIFWGTGFGPTSPVAPVGGEVPSNSSTIFNTTALPTATIGGQTAQVVSAALSPGYAALYQIAVTVPMGLANGDYPVVVTVSGVSTPANVLLTVQQ